MIKNGRHATQGLDPGIRDSTLKYGHRYCCSIQQQSGSAEVLSCPPADMTAYPFRTEAFSRYIGRCPPAPKPAKMVEVPTSHAGSHRL